MLLMLYYKYRKAMSGRKAVGKDTRLVNIYVKIHNKKNLTLDDMRYLAEYDPVCFEKTCKNIVYNIPEAKPVMEPKLPAVVKTTSKPEPVERQGIDVILDNLKRLEIDEFPVANLDAEQVMALLGNLYMEMLFPHNDIDTFMSVEESKPLFDKKA